MADFRQKVGIIPLKDDHTKEYRLHYMLAEFVGVVGRNKSSCMILVLTE